MYFYLDEIVDSFEVEEIVVWHVDADAEVEPGVAAVDDLIVPELNEIGVFRIADWKKTLVNCHPMRHSNRLQNFKLLFFQKTFNITNVQT